MLFRNSLRLLMENFKNVYKILLYKLFVGLIAGALCSAMILPELLEITQSAPVQELKLAVQSFFSSLFSADPSGLASAKEQIFGQNGALQQLASLIWSKAMGIILAFIGCGVVYLLQRFADSLCYFSVGSVINDKMGKYAETRLSLSYAANLKKACLFSLVYVPVSFLIDALTVALVLVLIRFVDLLPAAFLSMTAVVLLQAIKLTWTGRWMPAMTVDNQKLGMAISRKDEAEKRQRKRVFSNYLVITYAVIIINVVGAVCTVGSALLITIPMSYLWFVCAHYVHYYTLKGKKYFITFDNIAQNPDHGDSANFFEYMTNTNAQEKQEKEESLKTE